MAVVLVFNQRVLHKAFQHSVHPTGGSLRVLQAFFWLQVGSGKAARSHPAHQRVTQAVRCFAEKQNQMQKQRQVSHFSKVCRLAKVFF